MELQAGQNTGLTHTAVVVGIAVDGIPTEMELDVSAFMLTEAGKVTSDAGMVFYGAPASQDGAVKLESSSRRFDLDLSKAPLSISKIAIAITIDKGLSRGQRFAQLKGITLSAKSGEDTHTFALDVKSMSETALILAEVYQRNGQWKLRAVGQGFNGGLGPLAKHYGINISDDPDAGGTASPPPPSASVAPPPPPPSPAAAPPPAPRVNLTKITLEKSKPVSLEKAGGQFGEIVVNLRWTRGGGFMSKSIDLDVGAMIELTDGFKTVVQALGNSFGNLNQEPYVKLMGDDRSGSSGQGEFLHINGNQWKDIKRVLIFAFIYEGVPNWLKADGFITIRVPGQPELEARLDSPNSRDMMCAVAMLDNHNGAIRATKHVEYFSGHDTMDQRFGYGFRWKAGSK